MENMNKDAMIKVVEGSLAVKKKCAGKEILEQA